MIRWGLLFLVACSGARKAGQTPGHVDGDGDGYYADQGDCDDGDPSIYPAAPDVPGDGVDADCDGQDATVATIDVLQPGDLVFTEVMKDPLVIDGSVGEWFEVHNTLEVPVDLYGAWIEERDGSDDLHITTSLVIESEDYAVFAAIADPEVNGGVEVDLAYGSDISLSNEADSLVLVGWGVVIDEVLWDVRFVNEPGASMSLDAGSGALDNDDPESWCAATEAYGLYGYGSPGEDNEVCPVPAGIGLDELGPGDLVITEIMRDPEAVEGEFGEYFEVHNRAGDAVDLVGLVVSDEDGDSFELYDSLVVEADAYVVFAAALEPTVNGGLPQVDYVFGDDMTLGNDSDEIILSFGTLEIDEVEYDDDDGFPEAEGAAISLVQGGDAYSNDDPGQWCVETTPYGSGDRGTPGAPPGC